MITLRACAKINLFLRVVGRRADGYHEIETLFQRVRLADRLVFERTDGAGLELECRGLALPAREGASRPDSSVSAEGTSPRPAHENLVSRAYDALRTHYGERVAGARVVLEKRIPVGGGLGGGSADAAAALTGFDRLFGLGADTDSLRAIASRLGADAPFFLGPSCAVGRGIGDRLASVAHSAPFRAVLAFPGQGVSTPAAYARYDRVGSTASDARLDVLIESLESGDLRSALANLHNDLERAVFDLQPALGTLRAHLESLAGQPVRVTGSGSSMFTLAETAKDAQTISRRWAKVPALEVRVSLFAP